MKFSNIRVILIQTSHPGNLGAVARAMKNMGFSELYLVKPKQFPHPEAFYRSSGADDILHQAVMVDDWEEAVRDCHVIVGTSARLRVFSQPLLNPRQWAEKVKTEFQHSKIAIIFGPEQSGLDNTVLQKCHYHVFIPSVAEFSSLNLAAAVLTVIYEIRMSFLIQNNESIPEKKKAMMPTAEEMEGLYQHIESTMIKLDFLNPEKPRKMMPRIRRMLARAKIDRDDLDLLRGMFGAMEKTEK